jgi:hypothetical protein
MEDLKPIHGIPVLPAALRLVVVCFLCSVKLDWLFGDVAQLVRALPCHGRGRGFEPRRPRHCKANHYNGLAVRPQMTTREKQVRSGSEAASGVAAPSGRGVNYSDVI